jgi:O-antigen/teichoic acid export membrane protein
MALVSARRKMPESEKKQKVSIYRHMLRGSAFMLVMRWCMRLLGAISMVILARLLAPEDFGLVAMAMVAVNLVHTFTDLKTTMFVIREQDADDALFNTAWTVNIIVGLVVAVILFLLAPYAAVFFNEDRVVPLIHVAIISFVIGSIQNMGPVRALKDLNFAVEFRFNIYKRLGQFFVTIGLAFWLRNYWALMLGSLWGSIWGCLLSYMMFAHRPRLSLERGRGIFNFAAAIMPGSAARFLNQKVDIMLISNLYGSSSVGLYSIAKEFSSIFVNEIPLAANRALMPSYASISHDPVQLKAAYLHSFRALTIIFVAFGVGLHAIADNFVLVVLGAKWVGSTELLRWLSLCAVAGALLGQSSGAILLVVKKEWLQSGLKWLRVLFSVTGIIVALNVGGIEAVPKGILVAYCCLLPIFMAFSMRALGVSVREIASALFAPFSAAIVMVWVVRTLPTDFAIAILNLASEIVVGALVYILCLALIWASRGRPEGPEKFIYHTIADRVWK